ncbi:MAG TPA: DUF4157 domain-containing protein, partial [Bacteroidetes bacterium]|nr:DUF4157 domain-containing protein [Bacteroidota bacterium]
MKDHDHLQKKQNNRIESAGNAFLTPPAFSLEASGEMNPEIAPVQMKSEAFAAPPPDNNAGDSAGNGLPNDVRGQMEGAMGADFSSVKIEANSGKATQMGALAFAQGDSLHFAPGQFQPDSQAGKALIGHELAHVVQQREGRVKATGSENGMAVNTEASLEKEADQMGAAAASAQLKTAESAAAPIADYAAPIQKASDPSQPQLTAFRGADVNRQGAIVADAANFGFAQASGMKIRSKPLPGNDHVISRLKYGKKVQVQAANSSGGWYFVIADNGTAGWISQNFVVLNPPDAQARMHHITASNLTEILDKEYVKKGAWKLSTGNDYTTLAAAVLSANAGRKGISIDWKAYEKYKQTHKFKKFTDPWMIEN